MELLKQGDAGPLVGRLQQALVEAGRAVSQLELSASTFGPSTRAAVEAEQAAAGLAVDGVAGPQTWAALSGGAPGLAGYVALGWRWSPDDAGDSELLVVRAAVDELGVREDPPGSNAGPVLKYGGSPPGSPGFPGAVGEPWCACFVSWCWARATGGSPFGFLESAYKIWDWGRRNQKLVADGARLLPGDVFVILRQDMHGHVGLVSAPSPAVSGALAAGADLVSTVEGNSRDAVRGLVRARGSLLAFVRPLQ